MDPKISVESSAGGGYWRDSDITNTVSTIKSRAGNVEASAANNLISEGAQIRTTKGDIKLSAGNTVSLNESKDSRSVDALSIEGAFNLSESANGIGVGLAFNVLKKDIQTGNASKVESGGSFTVTAKNVVSQEATLIAKTETDKNISGQRENTNLT
ncbi:hypothetical protein JZU71_04925, partial [bacterium]|nr:hypothetical protein [bacterium]